MSHLWSKDVNKQTFLDHIALVSWNVVFSTCPGLVVRVEEAGAWLTPVPAHTVILA